MRAAGSEDRSGARTGATDAARTADLKAVPVGGGQTGTSAVAASGVGKTFATRSGEVTATMNRPSRLQLGWLSRRKSSVVTCRLSDPSQFIIQMLSPPPRSDVKAIRRPSGEKRGCTSHASPSAIRVGAPPSIGIV